MVFKWTIFINHICYAYEARTVCALLSNLHHFFYFFVRSLSFAKLCTAGHRYFNGAKCVRGSRFASGRASCDLFCSASARLAFLSHTMEFMIRRLHHIARRFYRSRLCSFTFPTIWFEIIIFSIAAFAAFAAVCSVVRHCGRREVAINLPLISIFLFRCTVPAILFRTSNQLESNFSFIIVRLLYFYFWRYTHTRTLVRPSTSDFSAQLLQRLFFSSFICSIKTFRDDNENEHISLGLAEIYAEQRPPYLPKRKYCARGT